MKKILYYIFEKYGWAKILISLVACIVLGILFSVTGNNYVFLWLASPFALWLFLFAVISFAYAWFINPIKWIISKFKK